MEKHMTADDLQRQRELRKWKECRDLSENCFLPGLVVPYYAQ